MPAANYHYVSVTPAGGSATLLHTLGDGGSSVITKAEWSNAIELADIKVSANSVSVLPVPKRSAQAEDGILALTLELTVAVNTFLQACAGKACAIEYRESVAAVSPTNPKVTFTGMTDQKGKMGGTVAGGYPTIDVSFSVSNGVAPVYATA